MERPTRGSRNRKGWYFVVSISLLVVMLFTVNVAFAVPGDIDSESDSESARVYKNLFEYRMCDAKDPNWCPEGIFKTALFDAMFADPELGSQAEYVWWDDTTGQWRFHYRDNPDPEPTMKRYTVDLCESGDPDGSNRCPDAHDFDVVSCTDGTRPVFYYEPGKGADANKWIFQIQEGADDCATDCSEAILDDNARKHFSSAYAENNSTQNGAGLFSNWADNMFRNYNVVMLDKCVGDRNLGDTTVTDYAYTGSATIEDGTGPVYFHGYRITLATLKRLNREFNLSNADEILFVTQSNGSNGAYHYIDRLSNHISQTLGITAPVRLLAQSFINPGPEVEYFFENGYWPVNYSDVPSSTVSPGFINAPNTSSTHACGPGFNPTSPNYNHWVLAGRIAAGGMACNPFNNWQDKGGVDGKEYSTEDFYDGYEQEIFDIWGVDNGVTETWDQSCVDAHSGHGDLRACRDSRHVFTHHLSTPVFFATQSGDRALRAIAPAWTMWVISGTVWSPIDMKLRTEKLAEVITGYESRSACADEDIANHGFFIDNTVDHMPVSNMSKVTRQMKANAGEGEDNYFQLQEYLWYWMDPMMSHTVQCLDSNDLYDVEFDPPDVESTTVITYPVEGWPTLVKCKVGYYPGGSQPYQVCDDPGFADPTNPTLNKADPRFICEGPSRVFLPLVLSQAQ